MQGDKSTAESVGQAKIVGRKIKNEGLVDAAKEEIQAKRT